MGSKFKGQALNQNVVILEKETKNITESGLDLTSDVDQNEKYRSGEVVSVGTEIPKDKKGNAIIKVGDSVTYDRNKATDFSRDGIKYKVAYYSDLFLLD